MKASDSLVGRPTRFCPRPRHTAHRTQKCDPIVHGNDDVPCTNEIGLSRLRRAEAGAGQNLREILRRMQRIRRALNHDHHRSNRAHSSTWLSSGTSPAMVRRSAGSFSHEYILPSAQLTAFARIAPRVRCTTSLSTKWCRTCVWTTRDAAPWCHPTTCAMVSLQVVCVRCERTRCSATRLGDQQRAVTLLVRLGGCARRVY